MPKKLPGKVLEVFKDVDLIIHAGDLTQIDVAREPGKLAPVLAVHGNMDPLEVKAELPEMNMVVLNGWKIGVTHDPHALWGMGEMRRIAKENNLNVLVFGHTHRHSVKWEGNVLFINPKSPTDPLPPMFVKSTIGVLIIMKQC